MVIQESGEMYLETILVLWQKKGDVRSVDVANELGYTKASTSRAMSILKKEEYITIGEHGSIILTKKGLEKATAIIDRHKVISAFLVKTLNIDNELAGKDACKIEHVISDEVYERMKEI